MKRVFIRFVSHEMRSPLNTAFMTIDILRNELLRLCVPEECVRQLDVIKRSCHVSMEVLDELLDYDKLEAGVMQLDRSVLNAHNLTRDAVRGAMREVSRLRGL